MELAVRQLEKVATAASVESRAQNQASCPLKINSGLEPKPVQNVVVKEECFS